MKRKITKILLLAIAVVTLSLMFVFSSSAKHYTSGDFKFNVGSKYAVLLEYTGNSETVKIPSKVKGVPVTSIGEWAFDGKKKMTSITIPSTVTKIGKAAFNECTGLTRVNFPKNLKTISSSAFWYCTSLKQVFIYDKVTAIGKDAFRGCNSLTAYVVKGSYAEKHIKTLDNVKLAYRYATSVKLSKSSLSLDMGTSSQLTYTVSPSNVYNSKVTFKSSNEKVATVSSKGAVKAVSCGTAVITCTTKDGSRKIASCTVKVVPKKVSGLKVSAQTKDSYKLSWSKADGASKYRINRYNSATKKWETVATTTKTYYNFKNLESGSSVRYAVRSYVTVGKTNYWANSYTYITAKTLSPEKVTGLKGTAGSNSVTLTWTSIDEAAGYLVYVYDSEKKEYYQKANVASAAAEITALESNATYNFAVKAYFNTSEGTVYSKYYSDIYKVTTLPGKVMGFAVLSDTISYDSFTLTWTKLENCSGYVIYLYDRDEKKYKVYETVKGNDITSLKVTGLEPSTSYAFKIRAYASVTSNKGEASAKLSVKTAEKLVSTANGFEFFMNSFNSTKNSKASFSVIKQCNILNRNAPESMDYIEVLNDIARSYSRSYSIIAGTETTGRLPVSQLIPPAGTDSTLKKSMIVADSLAVSQDGSGYMISFKLPSESAAATANSQIAQVIDWNTVAQENDGFVLNSCIYEGTTVKAKVREGFVDYMFITMPVRVNFSLNGETYEFTETIEYKYFFSWN